MSRLFGTDGVRGKANVDITPELAFSLGACGAQVLKELHGAEGKAKIVLGRDTRISGTMLESALTAGVTSAGCDVISLGVIPTAAVAWLTRKLGAVAGIVISASHNPAGDNGIKFFGGTGFKLPDSVEDQIEELITGKAEMMRPVDQQIGQLVRYEQGAQEYADYLAETLKTDLSGMKIVIDCANGAASFIAPGIFKALGAEVVVIAAEPDGWNINDKCGSTHPEALMQAVKDNKADIGLAFDGDADRLQVVDENGELLNGDQIMAVCAAYMKEQGVLKNDRLVVTVMSNLGLLQAMKAKGVEVLQSQVGDRYVIEKMVEKDAVLGGEQSGHIIFSEINTTGDGITSALYLLRVLKDTGKSISELGKVMTILPQLMKNVRVKSKDGWAENAAIKSAIADGEAKLAGVGRILVRPSGTEPLLRVMAEGPDNAVLEPIVTDISAVIEKELN